MRNRSTRLANRLIGLLFIVTALTCPERLLAEKSKSLSSQLLHTNQINSALERARSMSIKHPEASMMILDSLRKLALELDQDIWVSQVDYTAGMVKKDQQKFAAALTYWQQALPPAKDRNAHQLTGRILRELGSAMNRDGDNLRAIRFYYEAIDAAQKVDDFRTIGACYSMIGNTYRVIGDYYKAIEFALLAEANYKKGDYKEGSAWIAYTLGNTYKDLDLFGDALEYYNKALSTYSEVAADSGDSLGIAICLDQIGGTYFEMDEPLEARSYIYRSRGIYTRIDNHFGMSVALKNLAKIEYKLGHHQIALDLLDEARQLNRTSGEKYGMATIDEYTGLALFALGQYEAGIDSVKRGLANARSTSQLQLVQRLTGDLAKMYFERGQTDLAYAHFMEQMTLTDSLEQKFSTGRIAELTNIYEMEQKRQAIQDLEIQNQLKSLELEKQESIQQALFLGTLVLICFLAVLSYLFYKNRNILTQNLVSEKKRMDLENKLIQAQKLEAIGTMVGGVAHEFNNILQSLFLYSELVRDRLPDDPDLRDDFQHIIEDGNRAKRIVEHILTFSRRDQIQLKTQSIHSIVLEALQYQRAVLSANIDLHQEIDPDAGMVLCDQTQIYQIVLNLCNNAVQAMGNSAGTLSVTLKQIQVSHRDGAEPEAVVELTVSDTGKGMDKGTLDRIFDPFFTTKELGQGTGLGLSVIHGIVETIGGVISVISDPGIRTTFTVLLPLADSVNEATLETSIASTSKQKLRILIADDEAAIRGAAEVLLERQGYEIDIAENGEDAFQLFMKNPQGYDILVLDQSMPKMSGLELTREIRKQNPDVPIILSSGLLELQEKNNFIASGVSEFLPKPWTSNILYEMIIRLTY